MRFLQRLRTYGAAYPPPPRKASLPLISISTSGFSLSSLRPFAAANSAPDSRAPPHFCVNVCPLPLRRITHGRYRGGALAGRNGPGGIGGIGTVIGGTAGAVHAFAAGPDQRNNNHQKKCHFHKTSNRFAPVSKHEKCHPSAARSSILVPSACVGPNNPNNKPIRLRNLNSASIAPCRITLQLAHSFGWRCQDFKRPASVCDLLRSLAATHSDYPSQDYAERQMPTLSGGSGQP